MREVVDVPNLPDEPAVAGSLLRNRRLVHVSNATIAFGAVSSTSDATHKIDADAETVCNYFADENYITPSSLTAIQNTLGVDASKIIDVSCDLAMTSWMLWIHTMIAAMKQVARDVVAAGGRVLSYYFSMAQDEAPMKVTVVDHAPANRALLQEGNTVQRKRLMRKHVELDSAPQKLLNRTYKLGLLTKLDDVYKLFVWDPPSPYVAMASGISSSYFLHGLDDELTLGLQVGKAIAEEAQRKVVTDGDPALERVERARDLVFDDETPSKLTCTLHSSSKVVERQNKMLPEFDRTKHAPCMPNCHQEARYH